MSDISGRTVVGIQGVPVAPEKPNDGDTPTYSAAAGRYVHKAGGGGGGGAAIQPETGSSPIKISAFPDAAGNMVSTSRLTGLHGGANTNFTWQNVLYGANAAASSNANGQLRYLRGGVGDGTGQGGPAAMYGGNAGATGIGGAARVAAGYGGATSGPGGSAFLIGGAATSGSGGSVLIQSGYTAGGGNAGSIQLQPAIGGGASGNGGSLIITLPAGAGTGHAGRLVITGLPTSSAGLSSGDVWLNSNVLTIVP